MRKQVEALEDHPGNQTLAGDLGLVQLVELATDHAVAHEFVIDPKCAGIDFFQLVDAAQEAALARA
ncbi:hypothetical protein D3C79_870990 [compost metagenome]